MDILRRRDDAGDRQSGRVTRATPDAGAQVLGDGAALDAAIDREEAVERSGEGEKDRLVDVFAGDAESKPWTAARAKAGAEQVLFHQPSAPAAGAPCTCGGPGQFRDAFDVFSGGLLRGLDLKKLGLVAAGGAVLACVAPRPEERQAGTGLVDWFEARSAATNPGRSRVEADARTLQRKGLASPFCTRRRADLFLMRRGVGAAAAGRR